MIEDLRINSLITDKIEHDTSYIKVQISEVNQLGDVYTYPLTI